MDEKSETYTMAEAREMLDRLMHRAATDPVFRQLCLTDSRAAVKLGMGIEFPDEVHVIFVESRADGPGIVLPPLQTDAAAAAPMPPAAMGTAPPAQSAIAPPPAAQQPPTAAPQPESGPVLPSEPPARPRGLNIKSRPSPN